MNFEDVTIRKFLHIIKVECTTNKKKNIFNTEWYEEVERTN